MYLLIGTEHSLFAHCSQYKIDSLTNKYKNKNSSVAAQEILPIMMQNRPSYFTRYHIIKNYKTKTIDFYEYITPTYYVVNNNYKHNWQLISNSDTIISNYNCKNATCYFAGRNYTAWYTTEIPISDGPYKFNGLPGLIVKIEDAKKEHIFTLTSFSTIKYNKPLLLSDRTYQQINQQQYTKAKKKRNEEMSNFINNSNKIQLSTDKNALEIEMKIKKNNNFIEKY
jgi:GLPGLI family protein